MLRTSSSSNWRCSAEIKDDFRKTMGIVFIVAGVPGSRRRPCYFMLVYLLNSSRRTPCRYGDVLHRGGAWC
jgi:hypothetical protein